MSLEIFKDSHNWLYHTNKFVWTSDLIRLKHFDKWMIIRAKDGLFLGDCEDAALTIINRCLELGVPEDRLYVCRVATEVCKKEHRFDHAVGLYIDDDGEWWITDNRYPRKAIPLGSISSYKWYDAISIENLRGVGVPKLIGKA